MLQVQLSCCEICHISVIRTNVRATLCQCLSQYLSLTGDPSGKCAAAVDRDPGMIMALALDGFLHLLSGGCTGEHPAVLQKRLRCQKLVEKNHCSHRERCFAAALTSLAEGRAREATAILEAWLLE